jgi:chorismate synthase
MLRYLTAGESHGKALFALVDGFPAGVQLRPEAINDDLKRRQGGYGRGGRQQIETDTVDILTGVWRGITLGSPIALLIPNRDYKIDQMDDLVRPRPGHGDLSGSIKYLSSVRAILERASARETTARVAAGSLAKQLLDEFGITVFGYVVGIGPISIPPKIGSIEERKAWREQSQLATLDPERDCEVKKLIDSTQESGDTLGGLIEIRVDGLPYGLGTHAQWDRKLDGLLAKAVMAVQAMKGVEIGLGFEMARRPGSESHDPIKFDPALADTPSLGFVRPTNNAGGLEAGMTNAQPIIVRAAMKPISTLKKPLESVNLQSKQSETACYERSDVCAIAAASCVLECVVAFEIATALVDKFGGDSLVEMQERWKLFYQLVKKKLDL